MIINKKYFGIIAFVIILITAHYSTCIRINAATNLSSEMIAIATGKTYTIKSILKIASTKYPKVKKIIDKDIKIRVSSKNIKVKNNTFKANKTGSFWLMVQVKCKKYKIHLVAIDDYYQINKDIVDHINISYYGSIPPKEVSFDVKENIDLFIQNFNKTKYRLNMPKSLVENPGEFNGFRIEIIYSSGRGVARYWLSKTGFKETHTTKINSYYNANYTSKNATKFFEFVQTSYLSKIIT